MCYNRFRDNNLVSMIAPEPLRMQSAWGVAMAAEGMASIPAGELLPNYLRLSQAERERLERLEAEKKK